MATNSLNPSEIEFLSVFPIANPCRALKCEMTVRIHGVVYFQCRLCVNPASGTLFFTAACRDGVEDGKPRHTRLVEFPPSWNQVLTDAALAAYRSALAETQTAVTAPALTPGETPQQGDNDPAHLFRRNRRSPDMEKASATNAG